MNPVIVRGVEIGKGVPKICIPIVGKTMDAILEEAKKLQNLPKDLVEWRGDWYQEILEIQNVNTVLLKLREILGETPILFTCRTAQEGGQLEISPEVYRGLNQAVVESGFADLIDVEIFSNEEVVKCLITAAHESGVKVVGSNHDFEKTPSQNEIVARLCKMQELGADVLKIAVMPQTKKDVTTLLSATDMMVSEHARQPVVTMSMGKKGVLSRVMGEFFGSAITFGSAEKSSAPGQIPANELKETLEMIHHLLENE